MSELTTSDLDAAGLDPDRISQATRRIIDDELYWFPVRHHSPATAWHVQSAIRKRRPKVVFVEGPFEANHLIPLLTERDTRPPIAIYSSFQDDANRLGWAGILSPDENIPPRWACWYPLVEYSPELIAIATAKEVGATARFIDLPHYARLTPAVKPAADPNRSETMPHPADQTEKLIAQSDFYQSLAKAGGYRSWDEGWDALFECRSFDDFDAFREELLTFCVAARLSTHSGQPDWDDTLQRERFMIQTVRDELSALDLGPADAMVVCGGFHTAMDLDDTTPLPAAPEGTVYTTLVPYSYFRIADMSGYGAGNRAPQYYSRHWQTLSGKIDNPIADYTVSVLQAARKLGEPVSSADAISVTQHARMLAGLRGRSQPILDDLRDAIITCCCKGDPAEQGIGLQRAIDQVDIGNRIGKVASASPRLPIVNDFYQQIQQLGLEQHTRREKSERVEIDRRQPDGFAKAAFFHRLSFAGVPFCQLSERPDADFASGLIFRQRWTLKWSPQVEAKLIELNLLGDSLEAAAVNLLRKTIFDHSGEAGVICAALVDAMRMDLPNLIDQVFDVAMAAIEEDTRFDSMTTALAHVQVLDRHAIHHELRRELIAEMHRRAFARSCFAIQETITAPDDQHAAIVDGLLTLADVVLRGRCDEDERDLFCHSITEASRETTIPFLRGALLGMLVEIRVISTDQIASEIVGFAQSAPEQMATAGDFVHGAISVSRAAIMTGSATLVEAIDQLIRASQWDVFTVMLPKLRAAMELLHARHRQNIATRVAERYGLVEAASIDQLEVALDIATEIVELDSEVAKIMSRWSFAQ